MHKITLFFLYMLIIPAGFADSIVLNNQGFNPAIHRNSKIAVQWATSSKEIEKNNTKIKRGMELNPDTLNVIAHAGKNKLDVPKKAEYFRVLVWSKHSGTPDFLTNWIDIESNKTYTLNKEHLIPLVLMTGTGC